VAKLTAVDGPLAGQTFNLRQTTVLGRSFDADIRIDEVTVSRHHTKIAATAQGYLVEDLGSGNGTMVNGEIIDGATPLKEGDRIGLSHSVFRFSLEQTAATSGEAVDIVDVTSNQDSSAIVETLDIKATMMNIGAPQKAREPEAVLKAHRRLRTVVEISNKVTNQLDMDALLDEIMNSLFRVFPQADRGFIMLKRDDAEDEINADNLVSKVSKHRDRDKAGAITISRRVIDEVVTHRIAILTADAMDDDRFAGAMSVMNFQIRSMMCAPLIANEKLLGIIHIDTIRQDKRFTMDDLDLLTGVANQTAFAVANADMHQRLMRQQRIERDLQLARQVQESFLPSGTPEIPGVDLVATYRSALEVGGDFYDFIMMNDGRLAVAVGDVAGKGVPAALLMARMSSDMRVLGLNEADAGSVLTKLNARLVAASVESSFVTVIFTIYDPKTRMLAIANAAHCLPVLRRGSTGEVLELDEAGGFPLGALDDSEYEQSAFQLTPGDVITMFSDGVTEAMNAKKELYGTKRALAAIARPARSARDVMSNLLQDVQRHVGDTPQSDDLTIVAIGVKER